MDDKGRGARGRRLPIGLGITAATLAIILAGVITYGVSTRRSLATNTPLAAPPVPSPSATPVASDPTTSESGAITYSVTGDPGSIAVITWTTSETDEHQVSGQALPWTFTLPDTASRPLVVSAVSDGSSISCSMTIDGRVVDQQTVTGAKPVVMCYDG